MRQIPFREALREAMTEEMRRDDRVFLMGEEVAEYNGAYKVSQGMLAEFGPRRVIDTPIAELGFAAGVLTASSLIPQVVKTWKEKKAEDVSLLMLVILLTGIVLWIVYGIKREDLPIIATNSVSLLVNSIMIVLRIKFRK